LVVDTLIVHLVSNVFVLLLYKVLSVAIENISRTLQLLIHIGLLHLLHLSKVREHMIRIRTLVSGEGVRSLFGAMERCLH
jgi:hypothetical protein